MFPKSIYKRFDPKYVVFSNIDVSHRSLVADVKTTLDKFGLEYSSPVTTYILVFLGIGDCPSFLGRPGPLLCGWCREVRGKDTPTLPIRLLTPGGVSGTVALPGGGLHTWSCALSSSGKCDRVVGWCWCVGVYCGEVSSESAAPCWLLSSIAKSCGSPVSILTGRIYPENNNNNHNRNNNNDVNNNNVTTQQSVKSHNALTFAIFHCVIRFGEKWQNYTTLVIYKLTK